MNRLSRYVSFIFPQLHLSPSLLQPSSLEVKRSNTDETWSKVHPHPHYPHLSTILKKEKKENSSR